MSRQSACFFNAVAHFEDITDYHDLIDLLHPKAVECCSQILNMLMNICQQAQFHRRLPKERIHSVNSFRSSSFIPATSS